MIPKIIHYCWLSGDSYPNKVRYCIKSWKEKLPDYEFLLWDLNRFDINSSIWCKEALRLKKYAFVADYIRSFALYYYGGIYLDSDVEVIKPFDDLLNLPYFIGREQSGAIEAAIVGAEKGNDLFKKMIEYYNNRHFLKEDGTPDLTPMPVLMGRLINNNYIIKEINHKKEFETRENMLCIFPPVYFSPKKNDTFQILSTDQTYSIHHFNASWYPAKKKAFRIISKIFGYKVASAISNLLK